MPDHALERKNLTRRPALWRDQLVELTRSR